MNRRFVRALPAVLAVLAFGCSEGKDAIFDPTDPPGTIFIVESRLPGGYREALFQGRVVRDAGGCLRLENSTRATVIWPLGSTIEIRDGEQVVFNRGQQLAKIGEALQMGGGYGTVDHVYLSERDRNLALNHCPGEYWLAGP